MDFVVFGAKRPARGNYLLFWDGPPDVIIYNLENEEGREIIEKLNNDERRSSIYKLINYEII